MTKDKEITDQIEVIKTISVILKDQIEEIIRRGRDETSDQYRKNTPSLFVAYKNYIQIFVDTVDFINEKLETEDVKNFRFYLVHVRTLLDIFSSLLYILNQEKDKQIAVVVLDSMLVFSKSIRDNDDSGLKVEYQKQLKTFDEVFKRLNINVPTNPNELSKNYIKKIGYQFPKMEDILTNEIINKSCPQSSAVPNLAKSLYGTQIHFSDYAHGNPLTVTKFGNEHLWIIAKTEEISLAMADLIDNLVLDRNHKYKIETWIRHKKKHAPDFIKYWKSKSEKISEKHLGKSNSL